MIMQYKYHRKRLAYQVQLGIQSQEGQQVITISTLFSDTVMMEGEGVVLLPLNSSACARGRWKDSDYDFDSSLAGGCWKEWLVSKIVVIFLPTCR